MKTLLRGGTIYSRGQKAPGDVLIEDGLIAAVGDCRGLAGGARVVEAGGCHVLPGLIDLHVHIDDVIGRYRLADTWESGSRTAAAAGITTLGGFIIQRPEESLAAAVERAAGRAAGHSFCDYLWHLTPTRFSEADWTEILHHLESGRRTFKFYTTYRENGLYTSYARLQEIAERLGPGGARILVHAEDEDVLIRAKAKVASGSPLRAADHARLRPPEAELKAVERVAEIAASTGVWFHIVHVSTPEAAEAILRAGDRMRAGARLSCETAPHYIFLDDSWLRRKDGHRWLCTPPLRDPARVARLREMAHAGAFDTYATDHCAFSVDDKDRGRDDLTAAPMGLAGIGSLPRLAFALDQERPERAFAEMSLRLAAHPARLAGLEARKGALDPGLDADVAVFELTDREEPLSSGNAGSSETYPGFSSPLRLRHLFLRGRPLVTDGERARAEAPSGRCLWTN
ncbi:MAG: amidohydrolase family protein [Candidatus Aminicenantes bacterium]|nr:amidohydrolase family protein [Candidatus Aminicenantes bacterium]